MIHHFIFDRENEKEAIRISILNVMHLTASAWENLTLLTIGNSTDGPDFKRVWEFCNGGDWDEMLMGENVNLKDYVKCEEKLLVSELISAEGIYEDINNET